jgi:hypothetical protein
MRYLFSYLSRASSLIAACLFTLFLAAAEIAHSQDLPAPETLATPVSPKIERFAVDSSLVATSLGDGSLDVNGTFSPFGDINASGVRVRVSGGDSWYRFITNESPRELGAGHTITGGLLAGYQISGERVSFMGLIGPTIAEGSDQGVSSTLWGAKTTLSMYALPSTQTMAYASLSYSTIANAVQFQSKTGLKLVGNFYVGPEAFFSWRKVLPSYDNVATMRLGGHLSAIKIGGVQFGISAGWAHQEQLGSGYYGGLNLYWTF